MKRFWQKATIYILIGLVYAITFLLVSFLIGCIVDLFHMLITKNMDNRLIYECMYILASYFVMFLLKRLANALVDKRNAMLYNKDAT